MVYVGLPVGTNYGWGILGKQVVFEMAKLTEVCLLIPPEREQKINDEIDAYRIRRLLPGSRDQRYFVGEKWRLPAPVIQAAFSNNLDPFAPQVEPPYQVGFAVFEENILSAAVVERAQRQYRHLAAGSTHCAEILKQHGFTNVSTVLHGVDTSVFQPRSQPRAFLQDAFVVFSGGKFELRKGHDLVIRAFKVLQDRHADVFLINSWFNRWPAVRDMMQASQYISYQPPVDDNYKAWMNGLLAANGIDVNRVLTIGLRDHRLVPDIYHATDVGLFPNRIEGGTNMVMMEYMACGKPVVAAYHSGHKDVVRKECAVLIERHRPLNIYAGTEMCAVWNEPDLEETIEKLEWAYQHRDQLRELGQQAAEDMKSFTWERVARGLIEAADNNP